MQSKVDNNFEINESVWVISIINTGAKAGGHSILLVEGSRDGELFVSQHDIHATIDSDSRLNKKGYITQIRHYDSYNPHFDYARASSQSFYLEASKYNAFLQSIAEDRRIVNEAGLRECLGTEYEPNLAQLRQDSGYPAYQVVGSRGILHLLFGDGDGINCAEWCKEKLKAVGIETGKKGDKVMSPEKATVSNRRYALCAVGAFLGLTFVAAAARPAIKLVSNVFKK